MADELQNVKVAGETKKNNMLDVVMEWSLARKLSLLGVTAVSILLFTTIIMQSQVADYSLLFANMPSRDASNVVEWLKDHKIPYRLEGGGKDILVPADQVYEARLELAGSGLGEGGVGFEIFDNQSFGMTDFAQKVNYRRALQGELMRTITSLGPVEGARVHLALPEKRLFRNQQQSATASVIIKLHEGRRLKESQLEGIIHLVAGSVEGLESEYVTVVDSSGKALSKSSRDEPAAGSPGNLDYQQRVEKRLETRAQAMLDRALGAGNSMVRVTADVDFDQRERVEEALDPDGTVVISEQASNEKGSSEQSGGVPGVVSNLQEGGGQGTAVRTTPSSRSEETVNYELSKVVSKTVESVGSITSLSVSVLVADRMTPGAEGAAPTPTPRSPEELKEIETMVQTALGINDERGDLISVVSMQFETGFEDEPMAEPSTIDKIYPFMPLIKYALLGIAGLLAYLLLVRPLVRTLRGPEQETAPLKTVEELEAEMQSGDNLMLGGPADPLAQLRQEVLGGDMLPVQVIKNWLADEPLES